MTLRNLPDASTVFIKMHTIPPMLEQSKTRYCNTNTTNHASSVFTLLLIQIMCLTFYFQSRFTITYNGKNKIKTHSASFVVFVLQNGFPKKTPPPSSTKTYTIQTMTTTMIIIYLFQESNSDTTKRKYLDFLDILLTARDEHGQGMPLIDIRNEVDTFMFEGRFVLVMN